MRNKRTLIVCTTLLAAYGLAGFFALPPILKPRSMNFADLTLSPNFTIGIQQLQGSVSELSSRELARERSTPRAYSSRRSTPARRPRSTACA